MAGGFLFKNFEMRPIVRMLMDGVSSLNDTELLAVLIGSGGLSGTVADPKIIFGTSLTLSAAAIFLVHTNPS